MTEKELEELGFYKQGNFINQMQGIHDKMDLGWFGLRVDLKTLTPADLVRMIYDQGRKIGYKEGSNSVKYAIKDLLTPEE